MSMMGSLAAQDGYDPEAGDQVLRGEQHSELEDDNAMGSLASLSRYG